MNENAKRNHYTFGLGTIGRDMLYTLVSMYLMFYLTDVLQLSNKTLAWVSAWILVCRVFDAFNDPVMGVVVDNTRTRFGKFKPWVAFGAVTSGVLTVLLFTDFGSREGAGFVIVFGVIYLLWGMAFTTNDIAYWSMLPSLSMNQTQREKIGAFARICANVGLFAIVVGITPITEVLGAKLGGLQKGYQALAIGIVAFMWLCQCITIFGVKEKKDVFKEQEHTNLREMGRVIFGNDQLLYTAISMALFMIGYCTTTSFGQYFFKYAYGDIGMYSIFGGVLGVSQIAALVVFPLFSKRFDRKTLYTGATILVVAGYLVFFFSPMNMLFIGVAGVLLFVGQAFIQLLMLMFLADTVEYGQWKLGRRNDSVTFALQPFINKLGGAVASGVVALTVILSGINEASGAQDMTAQGLVMLKASMLLLPLVLIVIGYLVYRKKYIIDKETYEKIVRELEERGDIRNGAGQG